MTARDGNLDDDDSVAVMLDTFLDQRTAYSFQTNALSTQWDGRIADNGRTVDRLWDEAWRSAARRLDDRWTVELEIPLSILRFRAGSDRTWGLSFMRTVPRPPFGSPQVAYQTGTSELVQVSEQGDTLFTKFAWVF